MYKKILKDNSIGDFKCAWIIKGKEWQIKKWYQEAGVVQELAIHYLDLFQWLIGKEISSIKIDSIDNLGACDTAFVSAYFDNKEYVNITTSFNYPELSEQIIIIGSKKYLTYINGFLSVRPIDSQRSVTNFIFKQLMSFLSSWKYLDRKEHAASLRYFLDNIDNHKLKKDSLVSLKLIEKISSAQRESAEK